MPQHVRKRSVIIIDSSDEDTSEEEELFLSPHITDAESEETDEDDTLIPVSFSFPSELSITRPASLEIKGYLACGNCHQTIAPNEAEEYVVNVEEETKRKVLLLCCKGACVPINQIHEDQANLTVCRFCGEARDPGLLVPRYNAHFDAYFDACRAFCPSMDSNV